MQVFDDISKVNVPVLSGGELYIYVLENSPQGNVKIGRSSNMQKRLKSLSGSNSGGNKIIRCAVSDATWLYTLEGIAHRHFEQCRIKGTEWFDGNQMSFDDAVKFIDSLFAIKDYTLCNETRRNFTQNHGVDISTKD